MRKLSIKKKAKNENSLKSGNKKIEFNQKYRDPHYRYRYWNLVEHT